MKCSELFNCINPPVTKLSSFIKDLTSCILQIIHLNNQ